MRRLPPFAAIVAFESAARHESFVAAGAEINLTPSAISHQVKNLETWFGRQLFVRATRRLSLTNEGRRLLGELTLALNAIDEACAVLRPGPRRSQLAVHCAPSFATKWLGPRLAGFMNTNPTVTIRLSSSAEKIDLLKDASIDFLIAYGTVAPVEGVVVMPLGLEKTTPLCSPALLPKGRRVTPEDLLDMVLIESPLNPVGWADWCKVNGLKLPRTARPSFDRGALAVAAAVDGLGVALETQRFAEAELERGELVAITGAGLRAIRRPLHYLCYRSSSEASTELMLFYAWLKQELIR